MWKDLLRVTEGGFSLKNLQAQTEVETFSGKQKKEQQVEDVAIDTEDCGSVLFRFTNGAKGALWVSQITAGKKNCLRYELSGSQKAMAWNSEQPNELWVGHRDRTNEALIRDPAMMHARAQRARR